MTPSPRYKLAELSPGGILLDLLSGDIVQLNETAVRIWRLWLAGGSPDEIAAALVARFGIDPAVASRDVATALATNGVAASAAIKPEFSYRRSERGYVFSRLDQAVFFVDERGESLNLAPAAHADAGKVPFYLQGIAPKLLALRGHTVLHAAAVVVGSGVLALAGPSGAGKTTTARAMVRVGGGALCEDKLLIQLNDDGVRCHLGAEAAIARWTSAAAQQLLSGSSADCAGLDVVVADGGPELALREIGFLDALRRGAPAVRALSPLAVAGGILHNSFWGSDVADQWAAQLEVSVALARTVRGWEMTAPQGIPALEAEAQAWVQRASFKSP